MTEQEHYDLTTCEPCTCRAREKGLTAVHSASCLKRKQEERIAAREKRRQSLAAQPDRSTACPHGIRWPHPCRECEDVPPGYEEVLEGLRELKGDLEGPYWHERLDRAIAFLESLPESVKWSEMPGDTAFRCMECDWHGFYRDLQTGGACPNCAGGVEPL